MANKPFSIQESKLRIAGVDLEAGNTAVVIPGVTQATNYRVEEVEETGVDQIITFQTVPTIIDSKTFNDYLNNGTSTGRATYTCELDDNNFIDDLEVSAAGSYTPQEATDNAGADMMAYTGVEADPFASFVSSDWSAIPFRPKMRAGEVENIGGGNGDTGAIRFDDDTIHHSENQEVGIKLNPNVPVAKMYVETARSWGFDEQYDWTNSATWMDENGQGRMSFTGISQSLFELMDNDIGRFSRRTISINNGEPINIAGWGYNGPVNGTVEFYTETGPGGDPVVVTSINISAVFENRVVLDDDEGDFGFFLDNNNFSVDTQSDINLYAGDDIRIEGTDLFQLRNTSIDNAGIDIITRYGRGNENTWEFTDRGTLNTPTTGNTSFYAVFDAAHHNDTLTLSGEPWGFNIEFQVQADGTRITLIQNNTPFGTNPGYTEGMVFYFYEQDHGIPGYGLTITITDIQTPGEFMVTANLAASEPPEYRDTIYNGSTIKLTAADKTWKLGTDGNLYFPDGSFQGTAAVGTGNTGDVTFEFNKIFGNNNSLILKADPDNGYNNLWGLELYYSYDNDTHLRALDRSKGVALGFGYGTNGSSIRVEGSEGQFGTPNTGDKVAIVAARNQIDYIFNNGVDFSNEVTLVDGVTLIPGLSQRNETQIEVNLFVPVDFIDGSAYNKINSLSLGDSVIISYNTGGTVSGVVSQVTNSVGQSDPNNPTFNRLSFRIDGNVPQDYEYINRINFPDYNGNRSAEWIFDNGGGLIYPDGARTSGSGVTIPVDSTYEISLSRYPTASAIADVGSDTDNLFVNITEVDDIVVVQAGWQINSGTLESPNWQTVSEVANLGSTYRIIVTGFGFVQDTVYTFRNPITTETVWQFDEYGNFITPGSGTISHRNNDLTLAVNNTDVIVLRTGGGDVLLNANGGLETSGELTVGGQTYTNSAIIWQNGTGTVINNNHIDEYFIIATNTNTGTQRNWRFGYDGNLTFPDNTVQTTAWSGGRVVSVPAHSTGANGDQQGDLAFNSTHLYYCTADYNQLGHQVAVSADYLGRTTLNTNGFQLTRTVDTLQITPGDIISDSNGGATSTVVSVTSDENYVYVNTGGQAFDCVFPLTFTSTDFVSGGNIWKRIAWGGDTW